MGFKHGEAGARREVPESHHTEGTSLRGSQQGAVPVEGQRRHLQEASGSRLRRRAGTGDTPGVQGQRCCVRSDAHLIRVSNEEPLLPGLDLQGDYNSVAGVNHRSVVPSPQRLQDRDGNEIPRDGAADPPEGPQVLGWTCSVLHQEICSTCASERMLCRTSTLLTRKGKPRAQTTSYLIQWIYRSDHLYYMNSRYMENHA